MAEPETTHGLSCPNCGGMVPVPEGQVIVQCPYCDLRSLVRGERGLMRYQVSCRLNREQAVQAMGRFLTGHRNIAFNAARQSSLQEAFLAYLPFWAVWARLLGWVFGEKRVREGDSTRYKPREVKFTRDANWNGAACDVGEFGVDSLELASQPLEPFDADALHASGLVFEPVGSLSQARQSAELDFEGRVQSAAKLERLGQVFLRYLRWRMGLVYYPLWVLRYLYRGRSFQVVVDGYSGEVLYGKAPGNTLYRATVLVGGMLLGAILAVDASATAFYLAAGADGDGSTTLFFIGLGAIAVGAGVMFSAYRAFRYGEQFEYRRRSSGKASALFDLKDILEKPEEIGSWIGRLP
jgi:hypothetical protein